MTLGEGDGETLVMAGENMVGHFMLVFVASSPNNLRILCCMVAFFLTCQM